MSCSLTITMQARQEVVYAKESKEHQDKTTYNHEVGIIASPSLASINMQIYGIYDPGYQRPGFLGVPAPVSTPGLFCPNSSQNNGYGEHDKATAYCPININILAALILNQLHQGQSSP
ncbi:MAG TPA: hypothetical protein PL055_07405, partial [Methanobacterium sp.]|nr:hypothetical protein [Methanobacterium sp.]